MWLLHGVDRKTSSLDRNNQDYEDEDTNFCLSSVQKCKRTPPTYKSALQLNVMRVMEWFIHQQPQHQQEQMSVPQNQFHFLTPQTNK